VLFRASHHSGPLEIELTRRKIPFVKFGGLKFLEAAHIKDVLAFLRWAENPRDRVSGFRVRQLLPGVGPATAARLLDRLAEASGALEALADFRPPAACAESWPTFIDTLKLIRSNTAGWPTELDLACRWYAPHLQRRYEDAEIREPDLLQLAQIASTYSNRQRFLTELILDPPSATSDEAGVPLRDEANAPLFCLVSAVAATAIRHRLIRVSNDCHDRHASGEREGQDEDYSYLLHALVPFSPTSLPEPARNIGDSHHVLEGFQLRGA
jgi:superfamily I DNA/RNA helicase